MRGLVGSASINVIEVEGGGSIVGSLFRSRVRSLQGRCVMSQIMPEELTEVGESHPRSKCAFALNFVAHGTPELD